MPTAKKDWPGTPEDVAPLKKNGQPDLYNFMPTRFVSRQEAEDRQWTYFFVGDICIHGHRAPRFTNNPRTCVDCHRIKNSKATIGGKGEATDRRYETRYTPRKVQPTATTPIVRAPEPVEPDALEKRFLTKYAELREFDKAAKEVGSSVAVIQGRLSWSKVFRAAFDQLVKDSGLPGMLALTEEFEWTEEKRVVLMRVYIDTGDITTARAAINVSNFHFLKELETNSEFAEAFSKSEKLALRVLDETAVSLSIRGDSRLLQRVLAAKSPDQWGERMQLNMNVTARMTDEQINARLAQLLKGRELPASAEATDAEFTEVADIDEDGAPLLAPPPIANEDLL